MRQLQPNEKAQTGDFFLLFDHDREPEWIKIGNKPMPLKRQTLQELDEENKVLHYPLIVMRPTSRERIAGKIPEPYQFNQEQKDLIKKIRQQYAE